MDAVFRDVVVRFEGHGSAQPIQDLACATYGHMLSTRFRLFVCSEDPIGRTPARKYKPKSCNIAILTNVSSEDPFGTYFYTGPPGTPVKEDGGPTYGVNPLV